MNMKLNWFRFLFSVFLIGTLTTRAADWPQWRFDAGRTANSPEMLPDDLHLEWQLKFPQRVQVWDDPLNHDLMTYDRVFEPIVADGLMFLSFNDSDKVVAFNIESGEEVWRYYTDGPVRFSPVAWGEKLFFTSDDGYLYCVGAKDGRLEWKFRGAAGELKVIGNERVISAWPARGGPVIRDGVLYFAASIWPFMGTFIYALDAETGEIEWVNDGTSAQYIRQPHNAPSFAGVAPQGAFVATQDRLVVPGGRSVPAVFDRHSGAFEYFHLAAGGKGNGGSFVVADDEHFFAHTRRRGVRAYDLESGDMTSFLLNEPVLDGDVYYTLSDVSLREARLNLVKGQLSSAERSKSRAEEKLKKADDEKDADNAAKVKAEAEETIAKAVKRIAELKPLVADAEEVWQDGREGFFLQAYNSNQDLLWSVEGDASGDLIKAGNHLYAAGESSLTAFELNEETVEPAKVWSLPVEGTVQRLLAANGMLFAVTLEGTVMAFGAGEPLELSEVEVAASGAVEEVEEVEAAPAEWSLYAALTDSLESKSGYALCYGLNDAKALEVLLSQSELHVVAVDSNSERVESLRRQYDETPSVYGKRLVIHQGDPLTFHAPPYFASVVLVGEELSDAVEDEDFMQAVYHSVRPYGGQIWLQSAEDTLGVLESSVRELELEQARIEPVSLGLVRSGKAVSALDAIVQITREGALPGAADWTHQYGDIANTVKSDDQRVKLPLGLLWFGGSSNMEVLPRHGHGPPEQVVAGRTIIEGMDRLSARDVYTGRVIWSREIENLDTYGIYFNESYADTPLSTAYNQTHIPGANGRGSNYVATAEKVYVALEDYCEVLDAHTGKTVQYIRLPLKQGGAVRPHWGFIGVYEDILLGGHDFAHFSKRAGVEWKNGYAPIEDLSASDGLVAFDRHTGQEIWRANPTHGFLHNGIVAGNGRIYCLDKLPKSAEGKLRRRGKVKPETYRIIALDAQTGEQLWESTGDILGTWLGYSEEYDILLQAGAKASDRLSDETGTGMVAYQGRTGRVVWKDLERKYTGPCILHNELILTAANSYSESAGAFNLLTGEPHLILNPLTGEREPWVFTRAYGCNTAIAGEHMLTFRSGAAGFYDLEGMSGTGNLGGFRSSCTSNLVIANGVLNAPDYTRTCTCGYQNQTSLALIHMPDVEMWTYSKLGSEAKSAGFVKQAGINLGAPGDRLADNGTLWLEYPGVGGDSPEIDVKIEGEQVSYFRHHSARFDGSGLTWVAASGVEDVEKVLVKPILVKGDDEDEEIESENAPTADIAARTYTVRLHFSEPKKLETGGRTFSVSLQGESVLEDLDIVKAAGGARRSLVKEFPGVKVKDSLEIALVRSETSELGPVLCGVELVSE